jgi:NAD(P)-dependent dehydrogenase (short-subunit alcohol dehydrogenase family)
VQAVPSLKIGNEMDTKGTVFVTGGASGIGLAIARSLLEEGWRVVIADRAQGNLDAALGFEEDDARLRFESLDVADENAVEEAIDRCDATFGPLVGLVNSAGIFGSETPALETDTGLFRQILDINLIGSFITSRAAARRMRARGRGAIVNISSVSGLRGNFGRVAYGASKAAVIQMTKVMAVELAPDRIRVNAIAPGPVETPMVRDVHTQDMRAEWLRMVPQRRYCEPEELAGAALFLLDERKSSYITGQTICVDGGFTAAGLIAGNR